MAKTAELLKVSDEISNAIKAGRHPLTDDWNSPGYLNREEWDRMGSELERVVKTRVSGMLIEEAKRLEDEMAKTLAEQNVAKLTIEANQKEMDDMKALLDGEQAKVAKLTEDLAAERTALQTVRNELANMAGPTA